MKESDFYTKWALADEAGNGKRSTVATNPTTKTGRGAGTQEQRRVAAHQAAGLCSAGSNTCKKLATHGRYCDSHHECNRARATGANGKGLASDKWRKKESEIARDDYSEVWAKYVVVYGENFRIGRFSSATWLEAGGTQQQIDNIKAKAQSGVKPTPSIRTPKTVKSYDDSFTTERKKRGSITHRMPSENERKKSVFLEAELQRECIAYAREQGCFEQIVDNDSNPDTQYFYKRTHIGWAEFKSPTGRATEGQENNIKGLRVEFGDSQVARIFNRFEDFKAWLDNRIMGRQHAASSIR